MHSPEYTKKIKALLVARQELDDSLARCVYAFRNGRKPDTEQLETFKRSFNEALAILEPVEEDKRLSYLEAVADGMPEDHDWQQYK